MRLGANDGASGNWIGADGHSDGCVGSALDLVLALAAAGRGTGPVETLSIGAARHPEVTLTKVLART